MITINIIEGHVRLFVDGGDQWSSQWSALRVFSNCWLSRWEWPLKISSHPYSWWRRMAPTPYSVPLSFSGIMILGGQILPNIFTAHSFLSSAFLLQVFISSSFNSHIPQTNRKFHLHRNTYVPKIDIYLNSSKSYVIFLENRVDEQNIFTSLIFGTKLSARRGRWFRITGCRHWKYYSINIPENKKI